jgi:hypothetical protein
VLYNAMIAPLVPFAIRGAIWYQGESNAGRAYQYRTLFPIMIRDWRSAWGHDFPFYFVQLANWHANKAEPDESDWAELREAQNDDVARAANWMAVRSILATRMTFIRVTSSMSVAGSRRGRSPALTGKRYSVRTALRSVHD